MGIFGAALLYGDGMITPAITVLGAVEGVKVATPLFEPLHRARDGRHPDWRLLDSALRHAQGRPDVRADHGHLVPGHRGARRDVAPEATDRADGGRPAPRGAILPGEPVARLRGARRRLPRRHRRRGAVRGHGALRQAPDPDRLVRPRAPGPAAQLLRPGRPADDQRQGDRAALLPAGAALGALSARRAGHARRDYRVPGADFRRLLADAPGDSARLLSASRHRAHLVR